ncbi:MAG: glycerophosphodiester phosphodiesterase family protein [Pseudomonadota bacterium]
MALKLPKVIGHRGACGYAPENTLSSFHTAADMGVAWVEFDVKLTKDNVPIVFHDEELFRITGREGKVAETLWDDLKDMDAGSHFGDSFIGEQIPTLDDVLEVCIKRGLGVNIEIKACPGREVETAEIALDYASRIWPENAPPPLISSFQHTSLETARDMAYGWPRGFLINESEGRVENWLEMLSYIEPSSLHCNGNAVKDEDIALYLETGLPICCYTINDPDQAMELFDRGVTSVFSDLPDLIMDI